MRYKIGQIALVLGVILIIMGFSTSNVAEWVLGLILLGLGIFDYAKRPTIKTLDEERESKNSLE